MKNVLIWVIWLAIALVWLSPEFETVRTKISEHNQEIKKALDE